MFNLVGRAGARLERTPAGAPAGRGRRGSVHAASRRGSRRSYPLSRTRRSKYLLTTSRFVSGGDRVALGNGERALERPPPPRDGASKRRHWLRPDQFVKLIARKDVPRAWRDAYAVGLYLHLRPGELHELRVKDLDLDAGEVRICRAFDERTKKVTTPKTDEGIRTVTAPATLLPLLKSIAQGRDGAYSGRPGHSFRRHLGAQSGALGQDRSAATGSCPSERSDEWMIRSWLQVVRYRVPSSCGSTFL